MTLGARSQLDSVNYTDNISWNEDRGKQQGEVRDQLQLSISNQKPN